MRRGGLFILSKWEIECGTITIFIHCVFNLIISYITITACIGVTNIIYKILQCFSKIRIAIFIPFRKNFICCLIWI